MVVDMMKSINMIKEKGHSQVTILDITRHGQRCHHHRQGSGRVRGIAQETLRQESHNQEHQQLSVCTDQCTQVAQVLQDQTVPAAHVFLRSRTVSR